MRRLGNLAIQPSDVQYGFSRVRRERVEVGRLYDDGFLFLKDDPGVWIQSNPDSVSSVRSLELYLMWYKGERIGDSIGELSQLTHLYIYGVFCNLKCLPNTLSRLHNLHHLKLDLWNYKGERIGDSIGELSQLTHLSIRVGCNLKCLPNTLSRLHNLHHLELSRCEELEDLPPNFGDLYNLTYLSLNPCHSLKLIESVAKLSNLTTLAISQLEELPPNLGGLYNLKSLSLYYCKNYVIQSVTKLSNLTTLFICGAEIPEELPANLGDLKFLASLFLNGCYRLRCLPWSISKLSNLRFLHLTEEFRLETLPPHLNDSIIISVEDTHIRKTWKELKTQITEFPIITEELAAQKTSTHGYLQFKGDPTLWIRHYNNYGLLSSLRVLDLDLGDWSYQGKIPDSIGELSQLTHLYISNGCLPHHLPPTFSRLTHLSLIHCTFEFDSLGKLSTLTSLHLYPSYHKLLPEHMDLPISLTHLTLDFNYSSIPDSFMASMANLSNLNTLTLFRCGDLESLPLHLNLTKLILRKTTIKSLPIALKHLEIIHYTYVDESCHSCDKLQECWRNQLVNLETLSFTCSDIKSLLSLTSLHNLRELQLKDCFSLKELRQDFHKLVNLCTLDVSGTRIQSLPSSIINLYNLQCLILPKCFILKSLPDDFGNKVMISVDDTDESYYKHPGYHDQDYRISIDCDYMTSDSINQINEMFSDLLKKPTVIEQASPHRPSNHQPDATRIIEGSQFNGSTDPTSNNNPNASISSPNHEIENLPTSNGAGTIPVVVNECYSDVNANTMQDHDPMDIDEVGLNNSHAHAILGSQNQETQILQSNNCDNLMTSFSDIGAEPSFSLQENNSFGENNQQFFQNEHQIVQGMELEQDLEEIWLQYLSDDLFQSDHAQPFSVGENNSHAIFSSQLQENEGIHLNRGNNAVGENNSHAPANFGSHNQETEILQSNNWDGVMTTSVSNIAAEPSFNLHENNLFGENSQQVFQNERIDNSQSGDVQRKSGTTQKKEIPLERIEELMSQGLTVKVAAQQLGVSKSTLKRRLKEHGITWQSSRKQNPPDKNRNETHSTCKRNLSQQLNSVDHSDRGSHGQGVEDLAGPSQGPTLSYHLSSEHNAVNDSTPDVVTRTVGESPLSTQMCMDSHQRVEEHLNDGAAEHALVNTDLPPNERCSTFAVKAIFNEDIVRFNFSLSSSFAKLQEIVGKKLDLKVGTFKIKYLDDENEWVRMDDLSDLELAVSLSRSRSNVVRLSITKT